MGSVILEGVEILDHLWIEIKKDILDSYKLGKYSSRRLLKWFLKLRYVTHGYMSVKPGQMERTTS